MKPNFVGKGLFLDIRVIFILFKDMLYLNSTHCKVKEDERMKWKIEKGKT